MFESAVITKRFRVVGSFILFGALAGAAIGTIVAFIDYRSAFYTSLLGIINGVTIGASIGCCEEFVFPRHSRRLGYFGMNIMRFLLYSIVTVGWLVFNNTVEGVIVFKQSFGVSFRSYLLEESLTRDIFMSMTAVVVVISLLQIRRLHNPGDIRRVLGGRYYFPEEEDRIMFFADLEGSTALAERIGPMPYSRFIADCFLDISEAIQAWGGRVYQHLGDGIVITWPVEKGVRKSACLWCYFEMYWLLEARHVYYEKTYGAIPRFRVGIHSGTVIATWVGDLKRELAFHGDVLNTTARIQSLCKSYDSNCIVSKDLLDLLEIPKGFAPQDLGDVKIRGRKEPMRLYSIKDEALAGPAV